MADPMRNEVSVDFAGKKRTMRATVEAMRGIESETGKGIVRLVREATEMESRTDDVVAVIFHGLRGAENPMTIEEVRAGIETGGFQDASVAAMSFLHNCMGGVSLGKPQPKKARN